MENLARAIEPAGNEAWFDALRCSDCIERSGRQILCVRNQNPRRIISAAVTLSVMSAIHTQICNAACIDWSAELHRHGRWLRGVLLARSKDWQAVEELLQAVTVAVLQQQHGLRDVQRIAPWLYRIAVRTALLHRRQLGRQRRLQTAVADRTQINGHYTATDPLDWLLAVERNQLIRQALASLPSKEAELLVLKYTEDWSYRELATHLGITEAAVESRLMRARSKLREKLVRSLLVESEAI